MSTDAHNLPHLHNLDTEIVARYTDQPPRLPAELRRQVEASWNGAPVQLYALADLDHALRLTQVWSRSGPGAWPWPGGWTAASSGRSKAWSAPASRRCVRHPVCRPPRSRSSGVPAMSRSRCCATAIANGALSKT